MAAWESAILNLHLPQSLFNFFLIFLTTVIHFFWVVCLSGISLSTTNLYTPSIKETSVWLPLGWTNAIVLNELQEVHAMLSNKCYNYCSITTLLHSLLLPKTFPQANSQASPIVPIVSPFLQKYNVRWNEAKCSKPPFCLSKVALPK